MDQVNQKEFDDLNIQFIIDDFEMDGLEFKPVNSGLGFHGDKEKITPSFLSDKKTNHGYTPLKKERALQHAPEAMTLDAVSKGLESFYGTDKNLKQGKKKNKKKNELVSATLSAQLGSYFIDVCVIVVALFFTATLFSYIAYADISLPVMRYFVIKNTDFLVLLGSVYYLAYFTLMDGVDSIGKRAFSLRVISTKTSVEPSIIQLFNRAFLCLLGSILLFIPCVLDMQGRFSETTVVTKK